MNRQAKILLMISVSVIVSIFVSCATIEKTPQTTTDSIRYWSQEGSSKGLKAMTVQDQELKNQALPIRADPKLVIVMYHNLVYGRTGNEYNRDIYNFEHDLVFIRKRFEIIDFNQLLAIQRGELQLKHDAAIITFDDGDLSMFGIAYPLLREHDIKATFFIITGSVGQVGYMNWEQIRDMATYTNLSGERIFTIGSHGINHVSMGEVDKDTLVLELSESKRILEEKIGLSVDVFALPYGSGAGRKDIETLAAGFGYKAMRTSDRRVPLLTEKYPLRLPGIYIDNSGTDKAMGEIWRLAGR